MVAGGKVSAKVDDLSSFPNSGPAFSNAGERAISHQDQIARTIGIEILGGKIQPGDFLPNESELLARFHISRTVLREVLKTLAAKGFIISKTRVGTRVQPAHHWNFFDRDVLSWRMAVGYDTVFRDDLAEIRRAIEPRGAALAARRRTDEDVAVLRQWIARMRADGHTRLSFAAADLGFHLAIGIASGNPLISSIGSIIEAALVASFTLSSAVDEDKVLQDSINRHEKVVDAIETRDEETAAAVMLDIINHGTARIEGAVHAAKSTEKPDKQGTNA